MMRRLVTILATIGYMITQAQAQTDASSIPPPPENMAINYQGRSSSLGYVVALSYFSQAEMQDPLWEFARAKIANMWWCQSEARLKRRDVRWVSVDDGSGEQCAMVIYTSHCLEPRNVADRIDPPFENKLEQDLHSMMTAPVAASPEPGCGQKDRSASTPPLPN